MSRNRTISRSIFLELAKCVASSRFCAVAVARLETRDTAISLLISPQETKMGLMGQMGLMGGISRIGLISPIPSLIWTETRSLNQTFDFRYGRSSFDLLKAPPVRFGQHSQSNEDELAEHEYAELFQSPFGRTVRVQSDAELVHAEP